MGDTAEIRKCGHCGHPMKAIPGVEMAKGGPVYLCVVGAPRGALKPIPCDGDQYEIALKNHPPTT